MNLRSSTYISMILTAVWMVTRANYIGPPRTDGLRSQHLLQTEIGMTTPEEKISESKRRSRIRRYRDRPETEMGDDHMQMVTIDLSALRPSLPGLVLYKYGDLAPKLVQIDLDALNPHLQPHIIWPQFTQQAGDFGDSYFDFEEENLGPNEDIPFLGEDNSLAPMLSQRSAKMTSASNERSEWPDFKELADGDIYDFLPGSVRNEELMTLHNSLPLADEVIVPLDWEQDENKDAGKRDKKNVFLSAGWKPGGQHHSGNRDGSTSGRSRDFSKGNEKRPESIRFFSPFGSNGWRPGKRRQDKEGMQPRIEREVESEEFGNAHPLMGAAKKNVFPKSYGGRRLPLTKASLRSRNKSAKSRISGQESWSMPRKQWGVPQLFSAYW